MNIAAVVILFYPDIKDVAYNIESYLPFVDRLYIYDNSPRSSAITITQQDDKEDKIQYHHDGANKGIAQRLNQAAESAAKEGFEYLLTMDQDSRFENDSFFSFSHQALDFFSDYPKCAIIAPSIEKTTTSCTENENELVITSGNIIRIEAWKKVGGFNEKLFIDEVDHDFSFRLMLAGYKIIQLHRFHLTHTLGEHHRKGLLGSSFLEKDRSFHSPFRLHYMFRNYRYVRNKYKKAFPRLFKQRDRMMLTELKNNLLFSGRPIRNAKAILKGWMAQKELK